MPAATQLITSFLGGELSQFAQGRYDKQDYRTSMRVCLNAFPLESGAWTRRPGTQYAGHTRAGASARVIKFDYQQAQPDTLEFTDGIMRARSGAALITTNDAQVVVSVSTANPAVVQTTSAVTWATGDTLIFPGASTPLLENRQFTATKIDTTHFSLADALTGASIDGSTLGALVSGATVAKVFELQTLYSGASRQSLRAVQAETTDILLTGSVAPQMLQVTTLPSTGVNPVFSLSNINFLDGPYLDPVGGGTLVTPNAKTGIVQLTLSFNGWSSTQAYKIGDFVTSGGANYESLIDQNVNLSPATNPTAWAVVNAGAAIGPNGFQGSDVGRLVRLYSEPPAWDSSTTYSAGQDVKFNNTYWKSLVSANIGNQPGLDTTHWAIDPVGAVWSWGKITSLLNLIDRTIGMIIGDVINYTAAFDGNTSQSANTCANKSISGTTVLTFSSYIGKQFPVPTQISTATLYPSSDNGYCIGFLLDARTTPQTTFEYGPLLIQVFLRGKMTAPANATDGTTLAFTQPFSNTNAPVTLTSGDQVTAWNYVWFEVRQLTANPDPVRYGAAATMSIAEAQFFSPPSAGGNGVNVEILGSPLLYTSPISTWRLGVYSNTTGYPTCGCYHEGRLWLGGAVANRWDASVSNGISGTSINFAPTATSGAVSDSSAISYTFNSDGVNPIYWMAPDLQGVIMGTLAGEWLVQAPTSGPITPTNVAARRVTKIGSANVEPRRTEHTLVLVKRYFQKVMEYFSDVYSGKFSAPNLADKAAHITSARVQELAYTDATTPILWGRNADGSFFGVTYKRDTLTTSQGPTYAGWHRHTLGSGRTVESISSGPSTDGGLDALTMVTTDAGATGIRHIEVMTDAPSEAAALSSAWFLDDAVNPTSVSVGASSMTINGLWHLNGKTVQVFAGGLDLGDNGDEGSLTDFVVANGSITVPYGDGVSAGPGKGLFTHDFASGLALTSIVVGFTYNSDGQVVRLVSQADTGSRNGPSLGAPSRTHRAALKFVNSKGVSIGGNFSRLYPCQFKNGIDSVRDLPVLATYSGVFYDQVKDDFTYDDSLCWRISRPFPATVTAVGINLRTEDM